MRDVEIHVDLGGRVRRVGLARNRTIYSVSQTKLALAPFVFDAQKLGARAPEIHRMASAFEHDDLRRALAL